MSPAPPSPAPLGPLVLAWARKALEGRVRGLGSGEVETELAEAGVPEAFRDARGVFVTLRSYPSGALRGCIGFPLPIYPLHRGLVRAAGAAALDDPRFPRVSAAELGRLTVEVSVLSVPAPIPGPAEDRARQVRVGRDGLIVESGGESGLLLPQVAPEQGWSPEQFLDGTCEKAGLPPGCWRKPSTRVLRFQAEVFEEHAPP